MFNPFNPKPNPVVTDSSNTPAPAPAQAPAPAEPAPAPTPGVIPETLDLNFFNSLVPTPESKDPTTPLSVTKDILTPENLAKITAGQNFSGAVPQEILQKLQNGDQAATMEAVEHIARAAHAAALSQTGAIIDTVLQQQGNSLESRIKKDVESSINMRDISSNVPNIDQPVVRAGFEMISSQFREKFPSASPEQIRNMAQTYFTELSAAINPPSPTPEQQKKDAQPEVDWLSYAGFTPPPTN